MRLCMRADGVTLCADTTNEFREFADHISEKEKRGFHTLGGERPEHFFRVRRLRSVVKSQDNLVIVKRESLMKLLGPDGWHLAWIGSDDAARPNRFWIPGAVVAKGGRNFTTKQEKPEHNNCLKILAHRTISIPLTLNVNSGGQRCRLREGTHVPALPRTDLSRALPACHVPAAQKVGNSLVDAAGRIIVRPERHLWDAANGVE